MSLVGCFPEVLRAYHQTAEGAPLALYAAALRRELSAMPPERLALRVAATLLDTTTLALPFWDEPVQARYPELIWQTAAGRPLDELSQALLLHHLHHSDGTRPTGRWIAFTELPDGMFYSRAFNGYTAAVLARQFGDDLGAFSRCAMQVPGGLGKGTAVPAPMVWVFRVLPLVPLAVAVWPGDEDVPTSYRLLFDAAVSHHLSTDGCALVGSMLTRRLLRARSAPTA